MQAVRRSKTNRAKWRKGGIFIPNASTFSHSLSYSFSLLTLTSALGPRSTEIVYAKTSSVILANEVLPLKLPHVRGASSPDIRLHHARRDSPPKGEVQKTFVGVIEQWKIIDITLFRRTVAY